MEVHTLETGKTRGALIAVDFDSARDHGRQTLLFLVNLHHLD